MFIEETVRIGRLPFEIDESELAAYQTDKAS